MIIDSHIHYGIGSSWGKFTPDFVLDIISDSVDFAICSNLEGIDSLNLKSELDCNLDMIRTARKYEKLLPLAVCQVDKSLDASVIKYLLTEYPEFIGLKFHPECEKLPANSSKYDKYLEAARKFNKPCLYHSGHIKSRFSSPALIYEKAKQFPDVPIILGHLSTGPKDSHIAAIKILLDSILTNSALLYCDVSWMDFGTGKFDDVILLIKLLKNSPNGDFTDRILWASDAPIGEFNQSKESYEKHLEHFKFQINKYFNDDELLNKILYKNACELYKLKNSR